MKLHHDLVSAPDSTPTRAVLFLHGILGSGANLRSHARRFVQQRPEHLGVLIDLRAHGDSLGVDGEDTVASCANDLAETARALSVPVRGVVGHSFGGKVALAFAQVQQGLEHVLTLDSAPGPRGDARGSEATLEVLTVLEALQSTWTSRDAFVAAIEAKGLSKMLGQWLAMNLELQGEAWRFRLSLPRIHALLEDYFRVDLWPVVENAAREGPRVHLVIGARSLVYSHEDRVRAQQLEHDSNGRVTVDVLSTGHWVHVEDPQGVSDALARRLA
jgi:pimeloyl-ACP methyl ester carboxylesterase